MTYEEAKEELHKTAYKIVKLSSRPTDPFALRPGSGYLDVSPSGAAEVMVPGFLARSRGTARESPDELELQSGSAARSRHADVQGHT